MNALTKFRIVIFATMVLGAFASFAQNHWGNTVITICQIIIGMSFLYEACSHIAHRMKQPDRKVVNILQLSIAALFPVVMAFVLHEDEDTLTDTIYNFMLLMTLSIPLIIITERIYTKRKKLDRKFFFFFRENYLLAMLFTGLITKNLFMKGGAVIIVLSSFLLFLFYVRATIRFFRLSYQKGRPLVLLLTMGTFSALLMGVGAVHKLMHWPAAIVILSLGFTLTLITVILSLIRHFDFNGERITIVQSFKLFDTHIVMLFFIILTYSTYHALVQQGVAPRFYSQHYPVTIYKANAAATVRSSVMEALVTRSYDNFIERCQENGFLK